MDKAYLIVGILALSLVSGAAGITLTPASQDSCCGLLKYEVTLANSDPLVQKVFTIEVKSLDSKDIWVSLEPDVVVVPAGGDVKLTMFVRADCGTAPGDYRIRVSAGGCAKEAACGADCAETSEQAEAVLKIPRSCAPGIVQPQPDTQPNTQPDTQPNTQPDTQPNTPRNNVVIINPNGNGGTPSKPRNNVVIIAPNGDSGSGPAANPTGASPAAGRPPEALGVIVLIAVIIAAIVGTVAWKKSR